MSTIKVTDIKAADGTSALSIADSSGNVELKTTNAKLILPTGGGISFENHSVSGATGASSTTSDNVLDDYEEGTWTPVQGGTWSTGLSATGSYTKIGNVVYLFLSINAGAKSGVNGYITGIPFYVSGTLKSYYAAGGRGQSFLFNNDAFIYYNHRIYLQENTFAASYDYVFTYRV